MRLHERDAELEALAAAAQAAVEGSGRLVVVEARPGRGRTALLDEAATQAEACGLRVLRARGRAMERDFPFGIATQLFERTVTGLDDKSRDRLFAGAAALALPLFGDDPPAGPLGDDEHFRLVHGLYWLVANLAAPRPLMIAVDDLHLADQRSLAQLLYLAERIDGLRCTLVVTTASGLWGERLLSSLQSQQAARVLDLEPLSLRAVEAITAERYFADASPALAEAVHRVARGDALFVHELLSALDLDDAGDDASAVERLAVNAPRSITAAVARHLHDAGEDAIALACAAAVLGDDAPSSAVAEVAGIEVAVAEKTVIALVRAGVLAGPEPITFATPLVAAAVSSTIDAHDRPELHRRAAVALLRLGRPLSLVALHLRHTRPSGDDAVVSVLWAGAREAQAAGDGETAIALMQRALAEPAPQDVRPDLLIDLGTAEAVAGSPGAVSHLEEAVALHGSRNRRARALLEAGRAVLDAGRAGDAVSILGRGLAQNPPDGDLEVALQAARLAAMQLDPNRRPEAGRPARNAFAQRPPADTAAGRSLLAHAALEHALRLEAPDETRRVVETLVSRLAADLDAREAGTAAALAGALTWLDDAPAAEALLGPYIDRARRRSELRTVTALSWRRALARWQLGDITGVLADTERLGGDGPGRWGRYLTGAQAVRALALIEHGEVPAAEGLLADPLDGSEWHDSALAPMVVSARAHLALAVDRPEQALRGFERAGELATGSEIANPVAVPWRLGTALALARLGQRARARSVALDEAERADRAGLRVARGMALRAGGLATSGQGGVDLLRQAVAVLEKSSGRLAYAGAVLDLGTALLAGGRKGEAAKIIGEAVVVADRCAAHRVVERARRQLEGSGFAMPRQAGTSMELTPGERRVVELAVDGHSNRAIAEQLFVSVKAVEWHLRNAYAKLGVANRRELAGALGSRDRPPPRAAPKGVA